MDETYLKMNTAKMDFIYFGNQHQQNETAVGCMSAERGLVMQGWVGWVMKNIKILKIFNYRGYRVSNPANQNQIYRVLNFLNHDK